MSTRAGDLAADLFPGGVNSPVRAYRGVGEEPPALVRGAGSRVWTRGGEEFVDLVCAFGPLIHGHARREVVEAASAALAAGGPFAVTGESEVRLGAMIRDRMPAVERLRFVSSGTEAAMSALRVARAATGRELVVKFAGGYHGHADHLLARAGSGVAALGLPGSAGVPEAFTARTLVLPYDDLDAVQAALAERGSEVAAVIVEPVAANMGVVPPGAGFLPGLRRLCDRHGALLVLDEVITGFRVAPGGAQELFGIRPDLVVLGKIIGGGLPVGAYGGRRDLMGLVAPEGPVYQAGTLSGHPAAMAAGAAALELLDAAAYDRLRDLGRALEAVCAPHGRVARVESLLTLFAPPGEFASLHGRLRTGGVLVPPAQEEAWFLSTAHTDDDVRRVEVALA